MTQLCSVYNSRMAKRRTRASEPNDTPPTHTGELTDNTEVSSEPYNASYQELSKVPPQLEPYAFRPNDGRLRGAGPEKIYPAHFNLRLSMQQKERAARLAELKGVSVAEFFRALIDREYNDLIES